MYGRMGRLFKLIVKVGSFATSLCNYREIQQQRIEGVDQLEISRVTGKRWHRLATGRRSRLGPALPFVSWDHKYARDYVPNFDRVKKLRNTTNFVASTLDGTEERFSNFRKIKR